MNKSFFVILSIIAALCLSSCAHRSGHNRNIRPSSYVREPNRTDVPSSSKIVDRHESDNTKMDGAEVFNKYSHAVFMVFNIEVAGGVYILFLQVVNFFLEDAGFYEDSVAYHIEFFLVEYTGRNDMKDVFYAIEFECVTRIRAALKTGNHIVFRGEDVHYFTFTFIAPLQT